MKKKTLTTCGDVIGGDGGDGGDGGGVMNDE
jgi:hypothetical protein